MILTDALVVLTAYLLGSVPFALLVTRRWAMSTCTRARIDSPSTSSSTPSSSTRHTASPIDASSGRRKSLELA